MDRRRVLIRIFKVFLALILLWVLLAVAWLILPSSQRDDAFDSDALNQGRILSRLYQLDIFYPYGDKLPAVQDARSSFYTHMSLDIKLEKGSGDHNYTLILGTRRDSIAYKWSGTSQILPYQTIPLSIPSENASVSVSEPLRLSSRTASAICDPSTELAWINRADRALSCWWLKHDWLGKYSWPYEHVPTTVRTRIVPSNRTIELWPESSQWRRPDSKWHPPKMGPFLTTSLSDDQPRFRFHSTSASPSAFYPVRVAILAGLVPITLLFAGTAFLLFAIFTIVFNILAFLWGTLGVVAVVLAQLVTAVLGCVILLGIIWWYRVGRPPVPFREIKDSIVEAMENARERDGQIALPPDHEPDLEAQAEGFAEEMGVDHDVSPNGPTAAQGSARQ